MKISSLLLFVLGAAIGKEEDVMCALQGRDASKLSGGVEGRDASKLSGVVEGRDASKVSGVVASNHSEESDDDSGSPCWSATPGSGCAKYWLLMGRYGKRININQVSGSRRRNGDDRRRRESERRRRQPADCASAITLPDATMEISLGTTVTLKVKEMGEHLYCSDGGYEAKFGVVSDDYAGFEVVSRNVHPRSIGFKSRNAKKGTERRWLTAKSNGQLHCEVPSDFQKVSGWVEAQWFDASMTV